MMAVNELPWAPGTYTYISGHDDVCVWDAGIKGRGGDAAGYMVATGPHAGELPPFLDGTPARWDACEQCHSYRMLMHVLPFRPFPVKRWLCVACCPLAERPR